MSAKDKENKTIQALKQFFRLSKGNQANYKTINEFVLTEDLIREISKGSPTRIKNIKELCDTVKDHRLDDRAIEKLWNHVQDLLGRDQSQEHRYLVFTFLRCLIVGQKDRLGIMRAQFFRVIKNHDHPEDVVPRFELLYALTENGKNVTNFEEEIGQFLLNWLPEITMAGKTQEYLYLLDNLIKFHAVYIEDDVVSGLVERICMLCSKIDQSPIVLASLQVLQAVVAYKALPSESLPHFIAALCRTVNAEAYCQNSWKVMRHLLGTHKGHAALYTMCRFLQDARIQQDCVLIRGAVFYVNMALWGTQAVPSLLFPPATVLPSFLAALQCNQLIVTYEVILSIQRLVNKFGIELQDPAWDTILKILELISNQLDESSESSPNSLVASHLHETLNTMEKLIEVGSYNGNIRDFYDLIALCAANRPESSVLGLITYLSKGIVPTKHMWLQNMFTLLQKYYRQEARASIRLKVLDVLTNVITMNRSRYEDELIDRIVIPHMANVAMDTDVVIRTAAAEILVDLCSECESKKCLELLDILEKILNKPYESETQSVSEADISDVKAVVLGLVKVLCIKIHRLPSNHAVRIFKMLVSFLETHYCKPSIYENCNVIRYKIFECFLKMRADGNYHLGCADSNGTMRYSPYLCVANHTGERLSPPPSSPAVMQQPVCQITYLSLEDAFKTVIVCLKQEKDWEVLHLLLQEMPSVLQNKALVLSKQGNKDIDLLCQSLCSMITDKSLPEGFKNHAKLNRSDFHAAVLMSVAGLSSYHVYLATGHQQALIKCLIKNGLLSPKCSKQCITALTTCTLEMRDVMIKMLPEVLLELSKISATVHIAFPVLEFLSTLTRLPSVFASFVADQYMAVFAIALPYTNPFKYNHYLVSLAHHVIGVWFLKCRLPFRRDFVKFIAQGLQTNCKQINMCRNETVVLNEDSSTRKRSSSLTEQGSRRRERATLPVRNDSKPTLDLRSPIIDKTLQTFYEELTETCIDLMARYTFSPCSALPKRLSTAEFLLSGGQSMTWLVGNKLITVTTSGCSQNALRNGLCDRCWQTFRSEQSNRSPETTTGDDAAGAGKRPKSLLIRTGSADNKESESSQRVTRQNSSEQKSTGNTSASSPIEETKKITDKLQEQLPNKLHQLASSKENNSGEKEKLCACWCQGWAEVHVRRPTGDMSWIMRIQNQVSCQNSIYDFPLNEVATLFMPSLGREIDDFDAETQLHSEDTEFSAVSVPISIPGSPTKRSPSRQSSRDSIDEDYDTIYEDGNRSRNPVKRSNSSPEMSANWKNPFLSQDKGEKYSANDEEFDVGQKKKKDMRVSCEAIPEEISGLGTTPPSNMDNSVGNLQQQQPHQQQHPSLASYHSYPGTQPESHPAAPKLPATMPPSPGILQPQQQHQPLRNPTLQQIGLLKPAVVRSEDSALERPTSLTTPILAPLTSKPPQSPTQTSPRLPRHDIQKSSSLVLERAPSLKAKLDKKQLGSIEKLNQNDSLGPYKRDRGYTISVMSPIRKPKSETLGRRANSPRPKEVPKSGISPSFVFLQLYYTAHFGNANEKPLLIPNTQIIQRSLKVLDCIPPYETHKVGVIYVGPGQNGNETEILRNRYGSIRYVDFLQKLGTLIKLQDVDPQIFFLGGLEQNGTDGKFAYIWQDDVMQVVFHVATLMPCKENDQLCNNKKLHIGNDYVTIVYNESGEDYNIQTLKGQFNYASIIIEPLDHNTNRVIVKAKDELQDLIGNSEPKIISDQNLSILARQLALHANLASMVTRSLKSGSQDPYSSNWLERLRKIKQLRHKILQEHSTNNEYYEGKVDDFTEYT